MVAMAAAQTASAWLVDSVVVGLEAAWGCAMAGSAVQAASVGWAVEEQAA